jgi:hypothetical protein
MSTSLFNAFGAPSDHLKAVPHIGETVLFSDALSPGFDVRTADFDGSTARAAHQMVVMFATAQAEQAVSVVRPHDIHLALLDEDPKGAGKGSEPDRLAPLP